MTAGNLFKISFFASLLLVIIGTVLKITHSEAADTVLAAAVISSLLFIILAIYEVNRSTRIDRMEKVMWTIGFIFMSLITGIVYLAAGRSRVVA